MKKINKIALLLTAGALSFSGVNGAFITKSARFIRQPVHATRKMAPSMQGVKRVLGVPVAQVAKIASELQRLSAGASQLEKDTTVFMANLAAHVKNNFAQFKKAKFMQLPKAQQLHVLQRFQGRLMQGIKTQFHNLLSKHPYAARALGAKIKNIFENMRAQVKDIIVSEKARKFGAPNWVMKLENLEKNIGNNVRANLQQFKQKLLLLKFDRPAQQVTGQVGQAISTSIAPIAQQAQTVAQQAAQQVKRAVSGFSPFGRSARFIR